MHISIIVAAYNEAWNISRLLYNLLYLQDYSPHALDEIVVVCSGCTDGTDDIVQQIKESHKKVIAIVEPRRHGKTHALNLGIRRIKRRRADIVIFISGDVVPHHNSVRRLSEAIKSSSAKCAIAHPFPLNDKKNISGKFVHTLWGLHHNMNKAEAHKVTGEMFAVKEELLEQLPQEVVNDDLYIEYLVSREGSKFVYVPDAIVYMWGPTSLKELVEQRKRVNLGHLQLKHTYEVKHLSLRNITRLLPSLTMNICLMSLVGFGLIESFSRLLAFVEHIKRSYSPLWERIETSKGGFE